MALLQAFQNKPTFKQPVSFSPSLSALDTFKTHEKKSLYDNQKFMMLTLWKPLWKDQPDEIRNLNKSSPFYNQPCTFPRCAAWGLAWQLFALCFAQLVSTPTTCVLLSGSGRQLRPAEPPGDADADAEDEDSVSFLGCFIPKSSKLWLLIVNSFL